MVDAVACADHDHREALVAAAGAEIVGVAEWGRMPESVRIADVAIVVDERYRRRGIARALLRHLAKNGRDNGIDTFVASVLSINRPTIALVQSVAPVRRMTFEGTTVSVEVPLSA
jgi:ribosomal protein S18 acetylase RimI-like enzyme